MDEELVRPQGAVGASLAVGVRAHHRGMAPLLRVIPLLVLLLAAGGPAPSAALGTYDWPLHPRPEVVRAFAPPTQRWEPGHRGVDLAAAPGQTVYAAGPGTVHFVGRIDGRTAASILHPSGFLTTYEPLGQAAVAVGDEVARGSPLGTVAAGHPGCPRTACLHWGLRRGSGHTARYLDPRLLVGAAPVRLLPLIQPLETTIHAR